jgi:predicted AAA+ superfamily ATPase
LPVPQSGNFYGESVVGMKRLIDYHLNAWKNDSDRKPLLLRGARQVGKTYSVRELGKTFQSFVEINFDLLPQAIQIFEADLVPSRIVRDLSLLTGHSIVAGETLLFLDEAQQAPKAIAALRYFHEMLPQLHVIAAGSLLDFALDKTGLPVGRVTSLYLYPLAFIEFLVAIGSPKLAEAICPDSMEFRPLNGAVHEKLLSIVAQYLAVGGMPAAASCWVNTQDLKRCSRIHADIIESYRQDFNHYASKYQQKYVDLLFNEIPAQLGRKFKYSTIPGEFRKRELGPALDLLIKAGVVHKVLHASGQGVPLGADANPDRFKLIFLDCALAQNILGLNTDSWLLDAHTTLVNKGEIIESLIGQELLCASPAYRKPQLYYWHREARACNAEVDYLLQDNRMIIPIEVKSGKEGKLRSLLLFLDEHKETPFGLRFSSNNYYEQERVRSFPLYSLSMVAGVDQAAVGRLIGH